jgi:hypothetical protein
MEDELGYVMNVLKESIKKHGEKPLTNVWLLNILRMAQKQAEADDHRGDLEAAYYDVHSW